MTKDVLGQVSDYDIRLLRVFRQVVESGGFAAAESALGIARSAISQQMSNLEQRLGLRLCNRGRSGFVLTDEGRTVYQAAMRLTGALETFRSEVNSLHHNLRGTLEIGLTDNLVSMPQMLITKAIAALKTQGNSVKINIRITGPTEVEQGVLDGSLHVGVVPQATPLSGLSYQDLYNERSYLYCGKGHLFFGGDKVSEQELCKCDAIIPAFRLPADIAKSYQQLNCTASASDREGVLFLLLTGCYIGYLPDHYAHFWLEQGKLWQLNSHTHHYQLNMVSVMRKGRNPHLVLEYFLNSLNGGRNK